MTITSRRAPRARPARADRHVGTPGVTSFTPAQLLRTAHLFALDPDLTQVLAESTEGTPERPWARLARTPHLEVWLLGWPVGARTHWHDHGSAQGAFVTVAGSLTEYTFSEAAGPLERRLDAGQGRSFDGHHIHDVVNEGDTFAISVHAYSPALDGMTRYRLVDGHLVVTRREQADVDW